MEESLLKLSNVMSTKFEEFFIINGKSKNLSIRFPSPIQLDSSRNYKLGLKYFSVYNTIKNITEENNKFRYSKDGTNWIDITLLPGSYEIKEITTAIGDPENIIFTAHMPTNRVQLILKNNRKVDFTINNSFREILGFESLIFAAGDKSYTAGDKSYIAKDEAKIDGGISSINVHCDIINGGYINENKKNIIYSIPSFTVPIGYKIIEREVNPVYLPLNTSLIQTINLKLIDEDDREIDFGYENVTIQLHLLQV